MVSCWFSSKIYSKIEVRMHNTLDKVIHSRFEWLIITIQIILEVVFNYAEHGEVSLLNHF